MNMIDLQNVVKFLYHVPLFQTLKKNQLEQLAKRFVEREYPAGTEIVSQGHGGEGFFIVYSGKVDVIRERGDGTKAVVNQLATGDFFGELALLDNGIRTATAVTSEATICLVLVRWDFIMLLREDADMAVTILEELAKRFRLALEAL
jgi:CRP/FNR family transcriptional regulator, cyclic AMP receptor protein